VPEPGSGLRGLVGVGVASGIVPCPTALVVLLAAISLHRVGFGLLLIVAFSVGLAATMTAIGLLAVWGKGLFARSRLDGRAIRLLPAVSALAIVALGLVMTARAIPGLA
jgi:ABC-type nickel/cobalt efflux system permease component RcnA